MTLRKIADPPQICTHPEHGPPTHIVLEPGTWEHTCPGCGFKTIFTVAGPMYNPLDFRSWSCPPWDPYPPMRYMVTDNTDAWGDDVDSHEENLYGQS